VIRESCYKRVGGGGYKGGGKREKGELSSSGVGKGSNSKGGDSEQRAPNKKWVMAYPMMIGFKVVERGVENIK